MIIIAAISHTNSYYIPNICSTLIQSPLIDYVAPIMYSQMFGTVNEYISNYNVPWQSFFNNLSLNPNFINYGLNYLLPNIYNGYPFTINGNKVLDLYNNGGTNTNYPPNLYYYQSTSNSQTPVTENFGGNQSNLDSINQTDTGVVSFFNNLSGIFSINTNINSSPTLGGFIQWSNYAST